MLKSNIFKEVSKVIVTVSSILSSVFSLFKFCFYTILYKTDIKHFSSLWSMSPDHIFVTHFTPDKFTYLDSQMLKSQVLARNVHLAQIEITFLFQVRQVSTNTRGFTYSNCQWFTWALFIETTRKFWGKKIKIK